MVPIFSSQLALRCLAAGFVIVVLSTAHRVVAKTPVESWQAVHTKELQSDPSLTPKTKELGKDADSSSDFEVTVPVRIQRQPVSTPFRSDGVVKDATRPIYVIDRQQIEQRGARTVKEALQYLPGILGDGTVGSEINALSGQFIRGSNTNQVLIFCLKLSRNRSNGLNCYQVVARCCMALMRSAVPSILLVVLLALGHCKAQPELDMVVMALMNKP
jgi:TonB-dependent Receptor Plug Domain